MKTKIEKIIKQHNEMWAAFKEVNEELSEKLAEKWMPKKGEYATTVGLGGEKLIVIFKKWKDSELFFHYAGLNTYGKLTIGTPFGFLRGDIIRPATPSEISLLDSKLAEKGKRFDKEKLELVDIPKFQVGDWFIPHKPKQNKTNVFWAKEMDEFDGIALQVSEPKFKNAEGIYSEVADWHFHPDWCEKTTAPKHKEPIIGELAIGWDMKRECAVIGALTGIDTTQNNNYPFCVGELWLPNAILFESIEQYKELLKG